MAVSARRRVRTERQPALVGFLRGTYDELRKVVWPTPQELYRYTFVVIVTVVALGLFIWGVDSGLSALVKRLIG